MNRSFIGNLVLTVAPVLAALLVAAIVLSLTVFFRASEWLEGNHLLEVIIWQLATWAPWGLFVAGVAWGSESGVLGQLSRASALLHAAVSVGFATLHIIWFRFVSAALSPYVVLEVETLHGVFAWFFVFWFLLDLFVYWAILVFVLMRSTHFSVNAIQAPLSQDATPVVSHLEGGVMDNENVPGESSRARWLTVRTGDVSNFIRPDDVMWVEAQGDYVVLHLAQKQFWVNKTIGELEKLLDNDNFVRIHRSTIANLEHLDRIEKAGSESASLVAVMSGGMRRAISRRGKSKLDAITTPIS